MTAEEIAAIKAQVKDLNLKTWDSARDTILVLVAEIESMQSKVRILDDPRCKGDHVSCKWPLLGSLMDAENRIDESAERLGFNVQAHFIPELLDEYIAQVEERIRFLDRYYDLELSREREFAAPKPITELEKRISKRTMCRVDFFKQDTYKWHTSIEVKLRELDIKDCIDVFVAVKNAIYDELFPEINLFEDMIAVCIEYDHPHSHPIMFVWHGGKDR